MFYSLSEKHNEEKQLQGKAEHFAFKGLLPTTGENKVIVFET